MANYLYNGVELPELPEWDLAEYPCAVIACDDFGSYKSYDLYLTDSITNVSRDTYAFTFIVGQYKYYRYEDNWEDGVFEYQSEGAKNSLWLNQYIWNNCGITTESGEYIEASYPIDPETGKEITDYSLIPVEPTAPFQPLDPTSMLQGWLVGRAVASQRK